MTATLLSRRPHNAAPTHDLLGKLPLRLARAHEFCGPARRTLALLVAREMQGPVFWVQPAWAPDRLFPDAVAQMLPPRRLTFVHPKRPEDLLWTLEEILRAGVVPLVVGELPAAPGLTPVRRLHLAAEAGAALDRGAPLGLLLTPGAGGAPGVESRWHMAPRHGSRTSEWRLERRRARTAPPAVWAVRHTDRAFSLHPPAADLPTSQSDLTSRASPA